MKRKIALKLFAIVLTGLMVSGGAMAEGRNAAPSVKLNCNFPAYEYMNLKFHATDRYPEGNFILDTKDAIEVSDEEYRFKGVRVSRITGKAITDGDPEIAVPGQPGTCTVFDMKDRKF